MPKRASRATVTGNSRAIKIQRGHLFGRHFSERNIFEAAAAPREGQSDAPRRILLGLLLILPCRTDSWIVGCLSLQRSSSAQRLRTPCVAAIFSLRSRKYQIEKQEMKKDNLRRSNNVNTKSATADQRRAGTSSLNVPNESTNESEGMVEDSRWPRILAAEVTGHFRP